MNRVTVDEVTNSREFQRLQRLLAMETDDKVLSDALLLVPDFACIVLALANSSTYSGGTAIETVERAVVLLGRDTIRELAAEVKRRELDDEDEARRWRAFVAHNVAVAVGAGMMATAVLLPLGEEARTCGAIHDLGMQILHRRDPEAYRNALQASAETASRIVDHERFHCGTDHGELAEDVFRGMGLPESISNAVGYHHDPLSAPAEYRYLAILIFAGECLARRAGHVDVSGADKDILEQRVLAVLRIGDAVVDAYVPLFRAEMDRMGVKLADCQAAFGKTL